MNRDTNQMTPKLLAYRRQEKSSMNSIVKARRKVAKCNYIEVALHRVHLLRFVDRTPIRNLLQFTGVKRQEC